jgi:hypothetical protein
VGYRRGKSADGSPPRATRKGATVRFGNIEIRPLGGGPGCLMMILLSIFLSVVGTILLNLLLGR